MVVMKKIWFFIKNILKKVRDLLYRNFITEYLIPVKEQVILESAPEFADNTYSLYLEMLKNNYQNKYKIIWLITDDNINDNFKRNDIYYFNINKKGIFHKIKFQYLINSSKFIITCNRFYKRKTNRQVIIYLNHGQPLKDCSKLKMNFGDADASVTSSKFFVEKNAEALNTDKDRFIIFGPPRNDGLFNEDKDVKKIIGYENSKIVVWLPTFRDHADGKRVDSNFEMPLGIPIIYNTNDLEKFNTLLKKKNIVFILKPHFAANIKKLKAKDYSNFKIIYNKDLDDFDLTLYELLSASDALVTDYSSVYYDYLITKKPIALTLDDFDEYDKMTGFAYDYKEIIKGDYIYNFDDFCNFVDNLSKNVDASLDDRMKIIKKLDLDTKGNYSKKLFDYLVKKYNF